MLRTVTTSEISEKKLQIEFFGVQVVVQISGFLHTYFWAMKKVTMWINSNSLIK